MNIFVTSYDPAACAANLDDQRCNKLVLETAQLLSNAMIIGPYRRTHYNHPASIWTRTSPGNYRWLLAHFVALLQEYTNRFNREHKCAELLPVFSNHLKSLGDGEVTPFPNITSYKDFPDVRQAYRYYLQDKWKSQPRPPKRGGAEFDWEQWRD